MEHLVGSLTKTESEVNILSSLLNVFSCADMCGFSGLSDENSIGENELPTSQKPNASGESPISTCISTVEIPVAQHCLFSFPSGGGELVLNQCSSVQDSRTPLESVRSFHPGPGSIDAAHLLKVVSPPHTPQAALVEVHPDKTPGETVCQLGVGQSIG